MATILEGLNAISQAVGGAGEAESNLEALNAISGALGGSADATENAEAIANIAENASGGGGSVSLPGRVNISNSGSARGSIAIPGVWMEKQVLSPSATEDGPFAGEMNVPMDIVFKDYALAVPTLDGNGGKYIMGAFKFIPRGSLQSNVYVDGVTATGGTIVYDAEHYVVSYRTNPGTTEMTITFAVHGGTT